MFFCSQILYKGGRRNIELLLETGREIRRRRKTNQVSYFIDPVFLGR